MFRVLFPIDFMVMQGFWQHLIQFGPFDDFKDFYTIGKTKIILCLIQFRLGSVHVKRGIVLHCRFRSRIIGLDPLCK